MSQQSAQPYGHDAGRENPPATRTGPSTDGTASASSADSQGAAKDVARTAKEEASSLTDTAKQQAGEVAGEARSQARQLFQQSRQELMDQAGQQQQRIAGSLRTLADDLSSMSSGSEQGGMAKDVVREVSEHASRAASWLEQREPGSLMTETRSFARQRPGTFLAIAAGLGVLGGRLSRSMVDEAHEQDGADSTSRAAVPTSNTGVSTAGGSTAGGTGSSGTPGDSIAPSGDLTAPGLGTHNDTGSGTGRVTESTTGYPDGVAPARTGFADESAGLGGDPTREVPR